MIKKNVKKHSHVNKENTFFGLPWKFLYLPTLKLFKKSVCQSVSIYCFFLIFCKTRKLQHKQLTQLNKIKCMPLDAGRSTCISKGKHGHSMAEMKKMNIVYMTCTRLLHFSTCIGKEKFLGAQTNGGRKQEVQKNDNVQSFH